MYLRENEFQALVGAATRLRRVSPGTSATLRSIVESAYGMQVPIRSVETICKMAACAIPVAGEPVRPAVPTWLKERVFRNAVRCARCRKPFSAKERPELAHLIPVRLGGVTEPRNLAAFCFGCNRHQGGGLLAVEDYGRIWNR